MNFPLAAADIHAISVFFLNVGLEITLFFAVGFLVARRARRSPAARHAIWLLTLGGCLLTPMVAALPVAWLTIDVPLGAPDAPGPRAAPARAPARDNERAPDAPSGSSRAALPTEARPSGAGLPRDRSERPAGTALTKDPVGTTAAWAAPTAWVPVIERVLLGLWCLGVLVGTTRLGVGCWVVARLRGSLEAVDATRLSPVLLGVRRRLNGRPLPPIAWSSMVQAPVAVGCFRPLVLLPTAIEGLLSDDQLGDVLTHECAHVIRRDCAVGALQRLAAILFWPHPLVHVLNRRLAQAREELCDNYVLRGGRAADYARTLLTLAVQPKSRRRPSLSFGILPTRWNLEDRVRGLVDGRRSREVTLPRTSLATLVAASALTALLIAGVQLVDARAAAAQFAPGEPVGSREASSVDDATIGKWVEQLAQPDPAVRIEAMRGLRRAGERGAPAIGALVALLGDGKMGREARLTLARIGEPAVPALIEALRSDDKQVRWWAAQAIEEIGPAAQAAIPALFASFEDPDRPVNNAASSLAGMGVLALPRVLAILADPESSPDLRVGAAHTIWSIGPRAKEAVPLLIQALQDGRAPTREGFVSVRQAAIIALGSIGPDARAAAGAIASSLRDDNLSVRQSAVEALGEMGPGAAVAVPQLIASLDDEYEEIPPRAAEALGGMGESAKAAVPALVQTLLRLKGEENKFRRERVATALGRIGDASVPSVLEAYRSARPEDRLGLVKALGEIGIQNDQVLQTLISAIESPDSALRLAALEALVPRVTAIGPGAKPAIPAIVLALSDPDWEVRVRAAWTLFCIGPTAEGAVPRLVPLLDDSEFQVRELAVWALLSVGFRSDAARKAIEAASLDREKSVRLAARYALERIGAGGSKQEIGDSPRMLILNELLGAVDR